MPPAFNNHTRKNQRVSTQNHDDSDETEKEEKEAERLISAATLNHHQEAQRVSSKPATISPSAPMTTGPTNERLRSLPQKRNIPWRKGQELPSSSMEGARAQQKSGLLLVTRGQVQDPPCAHCKAGNGRFKVCVRLEEWFQGACASCVFPSKGSNCSLRGWSGARPKSPGPDPEPGPEPAVNDEPAPEVEAPSKKRKRKSTLKALESSIKKLAPPQEAKAPPSTQPTREAVVSEQPLISDLLNATYKKHKNGRLPSPQPGTLARIPAPINSNGNYSAHPYGLPTKVGQQRHEAWTAVTSGLWPNTQSSSQHSASPPGSSIMAVNTGSVQRVESSEKVREKARQNERQGALIDFFPKAQQRQVYGLIHGFQGGIDQLDRQLRGLKTLLGIEDDMRSERRQLDKSLSTLETL